MYLLKTLPLFYAPKIDQLSHGIGMVKKKKKGPKLCSGSQSNANFFK